MQSQGLVDVEHDRVRDDAQPVTHPLDGDRTDLFSLCLGVAVEARPSGWKQDLEQIDALDVRCHGNHRDDAATQSSRCRVGRVVADDDRRPALVGLGVAPWSSRWTRSEQARREPFGGFESALDPGTAPGEDLAAEVNR